MTELIIRAVEALIGLMMLADAMSASPAMPANQSADTVITVPVEEIHEP